MFSAEILRFPRSGPFILNTKPFNLSLAFPWLNALQAFLWMTFSPVKGGSAFLCQLILELQEAVQEDIRQTDESALILILRPPRTSLIMEMQFNVPFSPA